MRTFELYFPKKCQERSPRMAATHMLSRAELNKVDLFLRGGVEEWNPKKQKRRELQKAGQRRLQARKRQLKWRRRHWKAYCRLQKMLMRRRCLRIKAGTSVGVG